MFDLCVTRFGTRTLFWAKLIPEFSKGQTPIERQLRDLFRDSINFELKGGTPNS